MQTLYKSPSGNIIIRGKPPETTPMGFLFIMLREAIEPIILALGVSLLYSRLQSIWEITQATKQSWLSVAFSDSGEHPMIYVLIVFVFLVWVFYKSWKLKDKKLRDRAIIEALENIQKTLDDRLPRKGGRE